MLVAAGGQGDINGSGSQYTGSPLDLLPDGLSDTLEFIALDWVSWDTSHPYHDAAVEAMDNNLEMLRRMVNTRYAAKSQSGDRIVDGSGNLVAAESNRLNWTAAYPGTWANGVVSYEIVNNGANLPLAFSVTGNKVTVQLETDASGNSLTTPKKLAETLNPNSASIPSPAGRELLYVEGYEGTKVLAPVAETFLGSEGTDKEPWETCWFDDQGILEGWHFAFAASGFNDPHPYVGATFNFPGCADNTGLLLRTACYMTTSEYIDFGVQYWAYISFGKVPYDRDFTAEPLFTSMSDVFGVNGDCDGDGISNKDEADALYADVKAVNPQFLLGPNPGDDEWNPDDTPFDNIGGRGTKEVVGGWYLDRAVLGNSDGTHTYDPPIFNIQDVPVTIESATYEAEEGTTTSVAVVVKVASSLPARVNRTVNFATSGGTAVPGVDYTSVNQTLTFKGPDGTKPPVNKNTITIQLNTEDSRYTGGKTIGLVLSSPQAGTLDTSKNPDVYTPGLTLNNPYDAPNPTAQIVVADNEEAPLITSNIKGLAEVGQRLVMTAPDGGTGYQWQLNGQDLVDGGSVSGATAQTLVIDPLTLA